MVKHTKKTIKKLRLDQIKNYKMSKNEIEKKINIKKN